MGDFVNATKQFLQGVPGGGSTFDRIYGAVGRKLNMSKHDFARAMQSAYDTQSLRVTGWPKMVDDLPDPALAGMVSSKILYAASAPR